MANILALWYRALCSTTGNQSLALIMNLIYEYFQKTFAWSSLFISRQSSLWRQYFDKTPPFLCLRWKCDQILKDKLLQFKRGWPQFKTGDYQTEAAK